MDSTHSEMVQMDSTHTHVPNICKPESLVSDINTMDYLMSDMTGPVSSASHIEDNALCVFTMWAKLFHINFS